MAEPLWRCDGVLAATGGQLEGKAPPQFTSVAIDSRSLEPGALFVAIEGERLDGHDFVAQALASGAAAAVVSKDVDLEGGRGCLIRVADTLEALTALGRAARTRSAATIVAVTGSVGKTGTKEALRLVFARAGATHASQKSFNNQWGVPLTLANMAGPTRFGIFEIGMNHAGEITPLARLVRPHIAIVTTVEPVHLEFFPSLEAIAEAKAEIFHGLVEGGAAVLNRDNAHYDLLRARAEQRGARRVLDFGAHEGAYARLVDARLEADGSAVEAVIGRRRIRYRVGAPGRHHVLNSLAVLAAADTAGLDPEEAARALADQHAEQGRGARTVIAVDGSEVAIIDESYNANPASMRAALEAMAQTPRNRFPRRVAVLGDMLELGERSGELHRSLAQAVDAAGADVVFACGPMMAGLFEALPAKIRGGYAQSSAELTPLVVEAVAPGDVVMIKGSLGSRMEPIVEALRDSLQRRASEPERAEE